MAHFQTGYQFAEDVINNQFFTMFMQYFPDRTSIPNGRSIMHGTNQCAFVHFLKGINLFSLDRFENQDFSSLSDYDSYGALVISAQGCTNNGPGASLYISNCTTPEFFENYILTSAIAAFKLHYMNCDVTELGVGNPKQFLQLAHKRGLDIRNNFSITIESMIISKLQPTKLSNMLYFS